MRRELAKQVEIIDMVAASNPKDRVARLVATCRGRVPSMLSRLDKALATFGLIETLIKMIDQLNGLQHQPNPSPQDIAQAAASAGGIARDLRALDQPLLPVSVDAVAQMLSFLTEFGAWAEQSLRLLALELEVEELQHRQAPRRWRQDGGEDDDDDFVPENGALRGRKRGRAVAGPVARVAPAAGAGAAAAVTVAATDLDLTEAGLLAQLDRSRSTMQTFRVFRRCSMTEFVEAEAFRSFRASKGGGVERRPESPNYLHHVLTPMDVECQFCRALFFWSEKRGTNINQRPAFGNQCCQNGELTQVLQPVPNLSAEMTALYKTPGLRNNCGHINSSNAFASTRMIDTASEVPGKGPPFVRIHGAVYHRAGAVLPRENECPVFSQLAIYNGVEQMRLRHFQDEDQIREKAEANSRFVDILLRTNPFIRFFRRVGEVVQDAVARLGRAAVQNLSIVFKSGDVPDIRRYNEPTCAELAGIYFHGGGERQLQAVPLRLPVRDHPATVEEGMFRARIQMHAVPDGDPLHDRVGIFNSLHEFTDPMCYPLLFPEGTYGFHKGIAKPTQTEKRKYVTSLEFSRFRLQVRPDSDNHVLCTGRVSHQYAIDCAVKKEDEDLTWIRRNQSKIRASLYQDVRNKAETSGAHGLAVGRRVVLPSSYSGSDRHFQALYQDAMANVRRYGKPDLFITFTCNPDWPEIKAELKNGEKSSDRPDLVVRVFNLKRQELLDLLLEKHVLGRVVSYTYSIEFQKRGLPHMHLLLNLAPEDKLRTAADIDKVISAELPDPVLQPRLFAVVSRQNMHGPCGVLNPKCVCMKDGVCLKSFPKPYAASTVISADTYPEYQRRNTGVTCSKLIKSREVRYGNEFVVPYNPYLSLYFNAHINVESCQSIQAVKYVYKYVYKGSDKAMVATVNAGDEGAAPVEIDEIKEYVDARYICTPEAFWSIYGFPMSGEAPAVVRLPVHLPGQHMVRFKDTDSLEDVVEANEAKPLHSELEAYFDFNSKSEKLRDVLYFNFPQHCTLKHIPGHGPVWTLRKKNKTFPLTGRMYQVSPKDAERFYLRTLLANVTGSTSFEDLRTFEGVVHNTFQAACVARGLCESDQLWRDTLQEAVQRCLPEEVRRIFVAILNHALPADPGALWTEFRAHLLEDFRHKLSRHGLDDEYVQCVSSFNGLTRIGELMADVGLNMRDDRFVAMWNEYEAANRFVETVEPVHAGSARRVAGDFSGHLEEERNYDPVEQASTYQGNLLKATPEQQACIAAVLASVRGQDHCQHLILAPAGTGKSFVFTTLLAAVRAEGRVAIAMASSGIASLLLPGGRTAHSVFKIPLKLNESTTCAINQGTKQAELLKQASLFIWDEAPMMSRYAMEAVDRTLRDICQCDDLPFGGKTFVFGGDYRQILPVIRMGSESAVRAQCMMESPLWRSFHVHTFTINMRIQAARRDNNVRPDEVQEMQQFADFLMAIGNGSYPPCVQNGDRVVLPRICTIPCGRGGEVVAWANLQRFIYEKLPENLQKWRRTEMSDREYAQYITERSILCPVNKTVAQVNERIQETAFGNEAPFVSSSCDAAVASSEDAAFADPTVLPVEFLNSLNFNGIPPHDLCLNVGQALMMIRNLDPGRGLCNGTRLVLKEAARHLLTCIIATPGPFLGLTVTIPRCKLITENCGFPFELSRIQFPVVPAWSMTINKSQGQTMSLVGLYLQSQCFSHGQLYVALSRASRIDRIAVLSTEMRIPTLPDDHLTRNVVYTSVLRSAFPNALRPLTLRLPPAWCAFRWADAVPAPGPAAAPRQEPLEAMNDQERDD